MDKKSDSSQDLEQFYRLLADYGLTGRAQINKRQQRSDDDEANEVFSD